MEIGIYDFGEVFPDPRTGETITTIDRLRNLVEQVALADQVPARPLQPRPVPGADVGGFYTHKPMMSAIELLGSEVAPAVRQALAGHG